MNTMRRLLVMILLVLCVVVAALYVEISKQTHVVVESDHRGILTISVNGEVRQVCRTAWAVCESADLMGRWDKLLGRRPRPPMDPGLVDRARPRPLHWDLSSFTFAVPTDAVMVDSFRGRIDDGIRRPALRQIP
jgi:hypothetical protein